MSQAEEDFSVGNCDDCGVALHCVNMNRGLG